MLSVVYIVCILCVIGVSIYFFFFFFKQKTAYDMRISDWSSDVCSSDLAGRKAWQLIDAAGCRGLRRGGAMVSDKHCNFLINTGTATADDLESDRKSTRLNSSH